MRQQSTDSLPTAGTDIAVEHITMEFRRAKDEAASIKEWMVRSLRRQQRYERFRALDDVSFHVGRGEVAGIVGTNGSGKSTLLKIISGALIPTSGRVLVDRRKVQLLTLGTGFDPELTDYLRKLRWWDWDAEKIFRNLEALCSGDLAQIRRIEP